MTVYIILYPLFISTSQTYKVWDTLQLQIPPGQLQVPDWSSKRHPGRGLRPYRGTRFGRRELAGKNVTRFMWLLQDRETDVLIGFFHEDLVLDYAKKSLMGFTSPKNRILLEWYKIRVGR